MSTDDLEGRLRRLGQAPIAPEVEATHRHAIAQATSGPQRARFGWKAVALASLAGFFAGSTALAAAGSLPAPAQDVAHDALGAVGISVPRSTEGCPDGSSYRNHGEYVAAVEASGGDVRAAAQSDCGKPVHAGKGTGNGDGNGSGNGKKEGGAPGASPDRDGDPCTGPPPWAGTRLDAEAKEVARAEREATCGPDDDADDADGELDDAEEDSAAKRGATTTTVPDETTTVPDATTTTTSAETTTTGAETTTTQP